MCIVCAYAQGDDVIGCGGFVKSSTALAKVVDAKPDFSSVKVQLMADGTLTSETECAPNGYYYIPIAKKGEFKLKIKAPEGWNFESSSAIVKLGEDGCSDDVNFHFTGFSVSGTVQGAGVPGTCNAAERGPEGLTVMLNPVAEGTQFRQLSTTSDASGHFVFTNVLPSKYTVNATHLHWAIKNIDLPVTVSWGNAELSAPIKVAGYDVKGAIMTGQGEGPAGGVHVLLYGPEGSELECASSLAALPEVPAGAKLEGQKLLCAAVSTDDGAFVISGVPCGSFVLTSFAKYTTKTYDVLPKAVPVTIGHTSLQIDQPFRVMGFLVTGLVVDASGGGVAGVKVVMDGVEKAVTDKDGSYTLEAKECNKHSLTATMPHTRFSELAKVDVCPTLGKLPSIELLTVDLCGIVVNEPAGKAKNKRAPSILPRKLRLTPMGEGAGEPVETITDAEGRYCFHVAPGQYKVEAVIKAREQAAGLLLSPDEHMFDVSSRKPQPVLDITFSPVKSSITGEVICLGGQCGHAVSVVLSPVGRSSARQTQRITESGKFTFAEVSPGPYTVSVSHAKDSFCWGAAGEGDYWAPDIMGSSVEVHIAHKPTEDIVFRHSGYILTSKLLNVQRDSEVPMEVSHSTHGKQPRLALKHGTNVVCLKQPGLYTLTPSSCVHFDKASFEYDTSKPSMLELKPTHFEVTSTIKATKQKGLKAIGVEVRRGGGREPEVVKAVRVEGGKKGEQWYKLSVLAASGEELTLLPIAEKVAVPEPNSTVYQRRNHQQLSPPLLFYPPSRSVTLNNSRGCPIEVEVFEARPGVMLTGTVQPAVEGVVVTVSVRGSEGGAAFEVQTDAKGGYNAGAVHDDREYDITAAKESFHFQHVAGSEGRDFVHKKLGQMKVHVKDEQGSHLDGALLSLSDAGGYNQSNKTKGEALAFAALFPGKYSLKPIALEYLFEPGSREVEVQEGKMVEVSFTGKRVAYSVHGTVAALNGIPEEKVVVEAVKTGQGGGSLDETVTGADGSFRLRGFQPGQSYAIRVKGSTETSDGRSKIERWSPQAIPITIRQSDLSGLRFVVFHRATKFQVGLMVNSC
jgi:hypothetical protein